MKKRMIAIACATAMSTALIGCSGEADSSDAEGSEAAATEEAAEEAEHAGYITDETGQLTEEIGPAAMANITERLESTHSETGFDIQVLIIDSTNGEDSEAAAAAARSERNADALIFIAAGDQQVAVVGENIDAQEGNGAANAITTAFDNGNFENGLLNGIMATAMHMED